MTAETEDLERELVADLATLEERLADERFCSDLYRALAGRLWRKDAGPDGHVSLSWGARRRSSTSCAGAGATIR